MQQARKKKQTRVVKEKFSRGPISITPKTERQGEYLKALRESDQVLVFGPAGSGKTFIAASYAADQYAQNYINKIIITRPHVAVGKELGFLKGDILEKTLPWALPVLDVLEEHLGKDTVESAIRNGNIEVAPLALMRGRSFKNAMVIVDESQNITFEELKMLLTRVGEDTTIVINGDIKQSDLKGADGLSKIVHLTKKHMLPIPIIEFTIDDVVRSDMVKMWLTVFDKEGL